MHDLTAEALVPFADGRRLLPRAPSKAKLDRWRRKGLVIRTGPKKGQRVRLEAIRVGGEPCTSAQAFRRFLDALAGRG